MLRNKDSKVPKNREYVPKPEMTEKQKKEKRAKIALVVTVVILLLACGIFFFSGSILKMLSLDKNAVKSGSNVFSSEIMGENMDDNVQVLPYQDKTEIPNMIVGKIVLNGIFTTGFDGERTALVSIDAGPVQLKQGRAFGQFTVKSVSDSALVLVSQSGDEEPVEIELTLENTTVDLSEVAE